LLKEISRERRERFKRYDSIANFIEPNLKFGAGGLRDLEQALILADWFPERFVDNEYSFKVLDYYKYFFPYDPPKTFISTVAMISCQRRINTSS
jgi:[protein-PII] uridylyltransferase